jgi:hypothetical protein
MSDAPNEHASLQRLWDTYLSIRAKQGIDRADVFHKWAIAKRDSLKKFGADSSFDELCKSGCQSLPLAMILASIRPLVSLEMKWRQVLGSPRQQGQRIRALEKAAVALEDLQASFADAVLADYRRLVPPDMLESVRKELINPSDLETIWPKTPHPATTIHTLRQYVSFLGNFGSIAEETRISSSDMLWKYTLSAYVKRATGGFYDAQVSALVGAVLNEVYDEAAHRMWRSRNYERMDADFSFLAKLLINIGFVSSSHT